MKENNFKVNPHSLRTAVSKVEENKIVTRGYNQRDLIEKFRSIDEEIEQETTFYLKMENVRSGLLKDLLSGMIAVPAQM